MSVALNSRYLFVVGAISSKSKCQILVFPLCFPDIPYCVLVMYSRSLFTIHHSHLINPDRVFTINQPRVSHCYCIFVGANYLNCYAYLISLQRIWSVNALSTYFVHHYTLRMAEFSCCQLCRYSWGGGWVEDHRGSKGDAYHRWRLLSTIINLVFDALGPEHGWNFTNNIQKSIHCDRYW